MSAVAGPAVHHLVPFGKLVLNGAVEIREGVGAGLTVSVTRR